MVVMVVVEAMVVKVMLVVEVTMVKVRMWWRR